MSPKPRHRRRRSLRVNWNGHPRPSSRKVRRVARWALNNCPGIYVTSTTDGTHTSTSYHYRGMAVDLGANSTQAKINCQHALLRHFGAHYFLELFGPDNAGWVKNGQTFTEPEGTALENLHDTHVHAAA